MNKISVRQSVELSFPFPKGKRESQSASMTKSLPGSATKSNLPVAATIKPSSTKSCANTSNAPKNH